MFSKLLLLSAALWLAEGQTSTEQPTSADLRTQVPSAVADITQEFRNQTGGQSRIAQDEADYIVYQNLWFHNQRYHFIAAECPESNARKRLLGRNTEYIHLPFNHAKNFLENTEARWLPGVSVLIDFPYSAYPDNLGHWVHTLVPLFCAMSSGGWQQATGGAPVSSVLFANLERKSFEDLDWVWKFLQQTLGPGLDGQTPNLMFWSNLAGMDKRQWLGFETLVTVHNRGKDGEFWTEELGRSFREAAYRSQGLEAPKNAPRSITFMGPVVAEHVVNQLELEEHLREVASALDLQLRPYTATLEAPFSSFLSIMARTGVLVARHGPLLASSIFLAPGAVVVELLPYLWEWEGMSMLFHNLTNSLGDVHHFAWRARRPRHVLYATERDTRFAEWTAEECQTGDCLEVHARQGMMADCPAIQELLYAVLPGALRGDSVEQLRRPWPAVSPPSSSKRFSWED